MLSHPKEFAAVNLVGGCVFLLGGINLHKILVFKILRSLPFL